MSPVYPVYIIGEVVNLTCSAAGVSTVSRIQFFQDSQEIGSKEGFSPSDNYIHKLQRSSVSGSHAGVYSCQYWKNVSGQESPSDRSQSISITVTAHPVYIIGEVVNLMCSAVGASTVSGIRFYQDSQEIDSKEGYSPPHRYIDTLQLSPVSELQDGAYSCQYWKDVSGREIPSENSQAISIAVTARPSAPKLTVTPQHQIFIMGEFVTLTCSDLRTSTLSGIRFFRGTQKIHSRELPRSPGSYTSVFQLPKESGSYTSEYSCEYWKTESGREIASERSRPLYITVTARPSVPTLTLSPPHRIFIVGESVTLTCSVPSTSALSGIRFFRDSQKIRSKEYPRSLTGYTDSLQLPGVSGSQAGAYSCEHWKVVSGREIPSQSSQQISIAVTDPPPQPELSMDPPSGVVNKGLSLNITCVAPGGAGEQKFHFFKDGVEIVPEHLGSEISSTDPDMSSMNTSVLTILKAGPNNTGEYTCSYKKNVSGRWVLSLGSRAVNVTVSGINTGGILLVAGTLAAVIFCFRRKQRAQKLQESAKGSEGRECTSNLDPSHGNKESKAMDAGAEQREQGSEVTYAVIPLSALEAHTTQSKTKTQPAEEEHVMYSEVVTKHVQKPDN
ncbi:alpha-1B-glycoprotein-like [Emydura macquarii macquarii]|uniref:alpha-1B-glycoprotein-like n=1 Tax=Emydura macquarii macquarii TaxID=1129001 RepID=UPI00352AA506